MDTPYNLSSANRNCHLPPASVVLSQFQVCTIRINLTGVSQWQADVVKEAPKLTAPAALKSATLYDFRALGISSNVPSTDQSTSNPLNKETSFCKHCVHEIAKSVTPSGSCNWR